MIVHIGMGIATQNSMAPLADLPERRASGRFPVQENVRYRVIQAKSRNVSGTGRTLNIGSGGILFTTESELPAGRIVELSVDWPVRLNDACPLQLVATGRILRTCGGIAAVRIQKYEFKTRRASV